MYKKAFESFPVLETPRLRLRQLIEADANDIFALRSNAEVNKYLGRKPAQSIDDARAFIRSINESIRLNQVLYWAITFMGSNKLIGCIGLFNFSANMQQAEIGFELLPEYQGRGVMQEAVNNVITFGRQTIRLEYIQARTHRENSASVALLQRLHFRKTGKAEEYLDQYEYAFPDFRKPGQD